MKKQLVVIGLALVSAMAFGQKKELKKAQKFNKASQYTEAIAVLTTAESLIGSANSEMQAAFYAAKGEAYAGSAGTSNFEKMKMAAKAYLKAVELDAKIANVQSSNIQNLKAALVNSAIKDQDAKKYDTAAAKLYEGYNLSKQDTAYLYYAAGNAVNGKDYDTALGYYEKLVELGFTGVEEKFVAISKTTGEEQTFSTKVQRDLMVKAGEVIKPSIKKTASKRGEVLRNMTLIYVENGQEDKAEALMAKARKENPTDVTLIRAEADMAYKSGDTKRYNNLMQEIVKTDPDNPEIYYNLGIGSAEIGDNEAAVTYYEKAIELKPDYGAALINLSAMRLKKEKDIIEEMNNLGTSRADNARYDELKQQRQDLYAQVLPTLEKALELQPTNVELVRTILNIHSQLGNTDQMNAYKSKLASMEGGK